MVLVIGDVMLDAPVGQVNRISPRPCAIVDVHQRDKVWAEPLTWPKPIALGAQAGGATVGDDAAGQEIQRLFQTQGIGTAALVEVPGRPTTVKTRVISNGQQLLRVDEEQASELEESGRLN